MSKAGIEVIGRACRLPGAKTLSEFWALLHNGSCAISEITSDRFATARYLHPEAGQQGKTYTFRAGLIDDVWGFDPSVFSLSPREAIQMDPQQRLLLMLVWEALEDAGLPASSLAGKDVGVFVGNSGSDHSNRFFFDPASSDSFMMTGNTTSLVSNRISYIFDLHGPSFTVDTACSSSLVAMDQAVKRLQSGEIDTAIVAGVNMLLSPFPFVGFAAASMLSPDGLCKPFDANANGYVRAEGGVVLILQRSDVFDGAKQRSFGRIHASGINSDGRTSGVALPSTEFQAKLLHQLYEEAGISADQLAFIEAHGTGTRVGDPAEAFALGRILGQKRELPLPIGSVKSNIGHLEPASGLASVLKALLALEKKSLPATLHISKPNPDIPFADLNITLAQSQISLADHQGLRFAGINNFGFGGTNAHVIISESEELERLPYSGIANVQTGEVPQSQSLLLLSAASEEALQQLAVDTSRELTGEKSAKQFEHYCSDVAWHRELGSERLALLAQTGDEAAQSLSDFIHSGKADGLVSGSAPGKARDPVFVFSGNGSQFAGMGRAALAQNDAFGECFTRIDQLFVPVSGWSLVDMLLAENLDEQLGKTSIAQPLLFALQVSLVEALRKCGIKPAAVMGHSVGEVAAAWSAGILSLEQAVELIYIRSHHQEKVRGQGNMLVVKQSAELVEAVLDDHGFDTIAISAINTDRSLTLSGDSEELNAFLSVARRNRWACKKLDILYPFHSPVIDPIRDGLIADLQELTPQTADIPFYSSVTGETFDGEAMLADYWWRNVRQPVQFAKASRAALEDGHSLFLEIGPRPILKGYISEVARDSTRLVAVIESFAQKGDDTLDPVLLAAGKAMTAGVRFDRQSAFGRVRPLSAPLPAYPWQVKPFRNAASREAFEIFVASNPAHPLLGQQLRGDDWIWESELDAALLPYLQDHKVDGKVILPGAAFAEMMLVAGRQWLGRDQIELRDMDLLQALVFDGQNSASIRTRIDTEAGSIEISSRKRLVEDEWQIHVKARLAAVPGMEKGCPSGDDLQSPDRSRRSDPNEIADLYAQARSFGLDFGPGFQRLVYCEIFDETDTIELVLKDREDKPGLRERSSSGYDLHPLDLDGAFHGLNALYERQDQGAGKMAFIPVRLGALRLLRPGLAVRTARISILRHNDRGIKADINLFADDGTLVATLRDGRFRASALVQRPSLDQLSYHFTSLKTALRGREHKSTATSIEDLESLAQDMDAENYAAVEEGHLLMQMACRRAAYDVLYDLAGPGARLSLEMLPTLTQNARLADEIASEDLENRARHRTSLLAALLHICEQSDLATRQGAVWTLVEDCDLPDMGDILSLLLNENPAWSADCVMLNQAAQMLGAYLKTGSHEGADAASYRDLYSSSLLDHFESASPRAALQISRLEGLLAKLIADWPEDQPLRVLDIGLGVGALSRKLAPLIEQRAGLLVAADIERSVTDKLAIQFERSAHFEAVHVGSGLAELESRGPFDIILSAGGLQYFPQGASILSDLRGLMAEDALLALGLCDNSAFEDLVFGMTPDWYQQSLDPSLPISRLTDAQDWYAEAQRSGFSKYHLQSASGPGVEEDLGILTLLVAKNQASRQNEDAFATGRASGDGGRRPVWIVTDPEAALEGEWTQTFVDILSGQERKIIHQDDLPDALVNAASGPLEIVYLAGAFVDETDPLSAASSRTAQLGKMLKCLSDRQDRLWLIVPGGAPHEAFTKSISPVQSGLWAYGRSASNEFGALDIRLVDFDSGLGRTEQAMHLASLIEQPGDDSEIILRHSCMHMLRAVRGTGYRHQICQEKQTVRSSQTMRLHLARGAALDRLAWRPVARKAPSGNEVEIRVAAAGLNFRDVMWAQGLLPEEALEDGFAGPSLGFECSGTIVAAGDDVERFKAGDKVMALAPNAFASHTTVDEIAVSRLSDDMDLVAAASMPVAFLTSYYALHDLARLEEGEWVLIHGGAGAVGLAAIQIAKWCGARIIATAGNEEKRNFLTMLGADHVLDSRSLDFVDQVRAITSKADGTEATGVDVVLNSLFGEAMERSLELVRPFGRFLELGKRDFYGNSKIGLRPFRRNISYFGIDADQLLNRKPERARRLFAELTDLFEAGTFSLLPYRLFDSDDIVEAFRLMQKSGHIGKIVVKPPHADKATAYDLAKQGFPANGDGYHVIIGGLGGFGLEVARWLADQGARHIILTSRSGGLSDEARDLFDQLAARGVEIGARICDVTDESAVLALLEDLRARRPVKGVMHAAMVLEDAFIQNLEEEQIARVLAPKIAGGDILDRLTRQDELDYFLLFSSISVLFGNPGQSHYVTANAWLEGLARKRRAEGLPALAIGWGAITDVGFLARETETADLLAKTTGGREFTARQALDQLADLVRDRTLEQLPASLALAPMNWSFAAGNLPIMQETTFALLAREAQKAGGLDQASVDIHALIADLDDIEARDRVALLLAEEVAAIFRMPAKEINLRRSLTDIGMDSLMGMELRSAAQQKLQVDIPMSALGDGTSINDIATTVVSRLRSASAGELGAVEEMLVYQHAGDKVDRSLVKQMLDTDTKAG